MNKTKNKRLVLLDSHAILHRAYHALPDFSTSAGEPTGALYGLSTMLIKIVEDLKPDYVVACYDLAGPTYRHDVYKEYKSGRKKAEDDLISQIKRSSEIFEAMNIPIYSSPGFEADDILGTIVEQVKKIKDAPEIVIASGDMDTLQLVSGTDVKVYTLKKGIKDTIVYDEAGVRERFGFGPEMIPDYKGLRGDPSDNIPGVKGIGEKTATTLITTFGTIENLYKVIENGDEKKVIAAGVTPRMTEILKENKEEAEFSKMLATIRRDAPITFNIPEKTFIENLDLNKTDDLWRRLEFRTLGTRLVQLVKSQSAGVIDFAPPEEGKGFENVPADEFEKTAIALWLVNSNITNPSMEDIRNFAGSKDFQSAKDAIFSELDKRSLRKVYEDIELPLIPIIRAMDGRGIKVDKDILQELAKKYHEEASKLEQRIWKEAGGEFNISSPKQLGDVLFDKLDLKVKNPKKTGGGARSTRESELEKMRDQHPIVPMIFEYRELTKLLSTYIDAIPPLLDSNGRLHSHFVQTGSTTGRMSSQNPNLQNIPIKSELGKAIRDAFIAEDGYTLAAFDYSQMELRIAAFLSGDEKLIEIFRSKQDVHTQVASFVFKVPADEVTPAMRRQAKVINFGIIYGMGVLALKQNLGTSREEAQKFLDDYFNTFSTLASYLDKVKIETSRTGYTETFFGRRRYFEGITSKIPYIKAQAERMAINAPIQGTEADVIKLAMIKVFDYIKENKLEDDVYPLLQVHDELVYEIKDEMADKIASEIEKILESVINPQDSKGVVLEVEWATGKNWGKLK